jgi:hypothetical protein
MRRQGVAQIGKFPQSVLGSVYANHIVFKPQFQIGFREVRRPEGACHFVLHPSSEAQQYLLNELKVVFMQFPIFRHGGRLRRRWWLGKLALEAVGRAEGFPLAGG